MPVKKRAAKIKAHRITDEALEAWHACDYQALHRALGLAPWQAGPLPREICALGVSEDDLQLTPNGPYEESFALAIELQREFLAAAGWPAHCRSAYEKQLVEAREYADYCLSLVLDPSAGARTGAGTEGRRQALQRARERVAYRKSLLDGLVD